MELSLQRIIGEIVEILGIEHGVKVGYDTVKRFLAAAK